MHGAEKFRYFPMRKPGRIQPECPVYLYSYGLAVQRSTGAAFVQLRLVNRWESRVHSVFLHITGKDMAGEELYELRYVPLVDCGGEAHKDFGEEQALFLPEGQVETLDVEIEDVLFEDGMIWRRQMGQQLLTAEEAGWVTCSCGMKNPKEAGTCCYCRKALTSVPAETSAESQVIVFPGMEVPVRVEEAAPVPEEEAPQCVEEPPAPVVPVVWDAPEIPEAEEQEQGTPAAEEPAPQELTDLLSPLGAWMERAAPGGPGEPLPVQEEPVPEEAPAPIEARELTEETVEEPTQEATASSMDMMQETSLLIQELQRRIRAREAGQDAAEATGTETDGDGAVGEAQETGDRSRGMGFWIFMILLMILLALAGFFGILYLKGYFG